MATLWFALTLIALSSAIAPCTPMRRAPTYKNRKVKCENRPRLICTLSSTKGFNTTGFVSFAPSWTIGSRGWHECHVRIRASISNLTPGKHGMHIHTFGDIRSPDGSSTGGHFTNPAGDDIRHGFSSNLVRHWGDLGNIYVNEKGKGTYNRVDTVIKLKGIVGRGVTVHAGADKGPMFQPSGDSGNRIAICVIGFANPDLPLV